MAVIENTTTNEQFLKVANIDFVEHFSRTIESLEEMLGIHRKTELNIGDTLQTYKSRVELQDGKVDPGDIIPLSQVFFEPDREWTLDYFKYSKLVPIEVIQKQGFNTAVSKTDDEMMFKIQSDIRDRFFEQLELSASENSIAVADFQTAFAQAWGRVETAFQGEASGNIVFVNPLDIADYLSKGNIITQTSFGMNYLEGFMGTDRTVISTQVPKGTVYATAPSNLNLVFANVTGGEIGKSGMNFTGDSTGMVGISREAVKHRMSVVTYILYSILLFAERTDGVFKFTLGGEEDSTPRV